MVVLLGAALALGGCGGGPVGDPLTISFQAPTNGPLAARAADMRRGATIAIEAVDGESSGHPLRLVLGPLPDSIATIDALAEPAQQLDGQLMITLAPPLRRDTRPISKSDAATAPRIWLVPPQATARSVSSQYANSGADGARGTVADSPLRAGTPDGRYVTAALAADEYPPAGSEFFKKFTDKYGRVPDRWAIYGYESVGLILDAMARLMDKGVPPTQRTVAREALSIRDRFSPLGHYDVLPSGQSTLYVFQARGGGAPTGPASLLEAMR